MPFNKKKSYDLLKSNKKVVQVVELIQKNPNCKDCLHRPPKSLTPSSSSTGLIQDFRNKKTLNNFIKYYKNGKRSCQICTKK